MNKNLVTSLELSRKLEKLGVKQESEFYWLSLQSGAIVELVSKFVKNQYKQGKFREGNIRYVSKKDMEKGRRYYENDYSAFLSGELGEMLPEYTKIQRRLDKWVVVYDSKTGIEVRRVKILAEAMGKMLAYLIENKLIEVR